MRSKLVVLGLVFAAVGPAAGYALAQSDSDADQYGAGLSQPVPASECPEAAKALADEGHPIDYFVTGCPSPTDLVAAITAIDKHVAEFQAMAQGAAVEPAEEAGER